MGAPAPAHARAGSGGPARVRVTDRGIGLGLKGPARGWVLLGVRCLLAALDLVDRVELLWVVLAHCRGGGVPHGPLRDVRREPPAPGSRRTAGSGCCA